MAPGEPGVKRLKREPSARLEVLLDQLLQSQSPGSGAEQVNVVLQVSWAEAEDGGLVSY